MKTVSDLEIKEMTINGLKVILQDGGKEIERTCPKCHKRKPLSQFGLRIMECKTELRNQSYCTPCRNH